ncbi:MAG: hypothetical protein H8D26_05190 [Methanomicrobia archaeon]|nr:hypothetical protein [Methanomicrobia archaeon]
MKRWYQSKTLWVNLIAVAALITQAQFGFVIAPEEQVGILALINLILRAATSEGLTK